MLTRSLAHLAAACGSVHLMVRVASPVFASVVTVRMLLLKYAFPFQRVGTSSGRVSFHFFWRGSQLFQNNTGNRSFCWMYFSVSASDCSTASDSDFLVSLPAANPASDASPPNWLSKEPIPPS